MSHCLMYSPGVRSISNDGQNDESLLMRRDMIPLVLSVALFVGAMAAWFQLRLSVEPGQTHERLVRTAYPTTVHHDFPLPGRRAFRR